MEQKAVDLAAKLLANEDISVARAKTSTASFNIESRVLTLPMWKEMTPEVEDMLVGHEVGHALYTTNEYTETLQENKALKSYLNVLEDVRIEKLLKRKYPGMRRRMAEGYRQLIERDFFETEGKDLNKALLIDRINLYYKSQATIDFTPEEKQFVVRAERTESIQDVINLAKEVFAYAKAKYEEEKKELEEMELEAIASGEADGDDDYDDDFEEMNLPIDPSEDYSEDDDDEGDQFTNGDGDSDGEMESDGLSSNPSPELGNDASALESKTDKAFQNNLEELADTETDYIYYDLYTPASDDIFVSYKKIINEIEVGLDRFKTPEYAENTKELHENFLKFKTESQKTVNYLVKEFEMRKSATAYKRTTVAKSGQLDMKKIFGYQINDDLFKRISVVQEGKRHGMTILVDWSGSMHYVIEDTIKQLINLSLFCQRVQIPFRAFAFTTQYRDGDRIMRETKRALKYAAEKDVRDSGKIMIHAGHEFKMLELFSDKMSSSEFWKQAENLVDYRSRWIPSFQLGSTPLNESLMYLYNNYLDGFIRKNNIEKMTFITLTDGEGHALETINGSHGLRDRKMKQDGYWDNEKDVRVPPVWTKIKNFYTDPVTKKTYEFTHDNNKQTRTLLKMIKDRYNCRVVGFYITSTNRRELYWAIRSNTTIEGYDVDRHINILRKSFREEGFHSFTKTGGHDELFVLSQRKMKITDDNLEATGDMTPRKLASNFSKFMNQKQTSRVLLNRFVGWVA